MTVFYHAAPMHLWSCYEHLSVCRSVHLSVKCVNCDKTKESSAQILTPYERSMHLVLQHEEWLVGDIPFYLKFGAKLTHPRKMTDRSIWNMLVEEHHSVRADQGNQTQTAVEKHDCRHCRQHGTSKNETAISFF